MLTVFFLFVCFCLLFFKLVLASDRVFIKNKTSVFLECTCVYMHLCICVHRYKQRHVSMRVNTYKYLFRSLCL